MNTRLSRVAILLTAVGLSSVAELRADEPGTTQWLSDSGSWYEHVLKEVGATLPRRDAVDERVVNEVRTGAGHIIKWVKDAGGWPDFPSTTAADQAP